jgi:hypothetical protein
LQQAHAEKESKKAYAKREASDIQTFIKIEKFELISNKSSLD